MEIVRFLQQIGSQWYRLQLCLKKFATFDVERDDGLGSLKNPLGVTL